MSSERIYVHEKGEGKGWGDGEKVTAFNKRRKHNQANTYTGFRPRVELEPEYFFLREKWCAHPRINKSFSAVINSLLEGLKNACEQTTEIDENGQISIELNLGRITIK